MRAATSSDMVHRASAPPRVTLSTGSAGANSISTCRQIPQGGVGASASVAITSASNSRTPSRDGRAHRDALGTRSRRVRRVLNVAAFHHRSVRREQRRADAEARIRRVRPLHRGLRVGPKGPPGVAATARAADPHRRAQCPRSSAGRNDVPFPRNADVQPLRHRRAQIRERLTLAQWNGMHRLAEREQRHVLPRVIGRAGRRIVAVVGRDEEQVVLAERGSGSPAGRRRTRAAPARTPPGRSGARTACRNLPGWRTATHPAPRGAIPGWPGSPRRCPLVCASSSERPANRSSTLPTPARGTPAAARCVEQRLLRRGEANSRAGSSCARTPRRGRRTAAR